MLPAMSILLINISKIYMSNNTLKNIFEQLDGIDLNDSPVPMKTGTSNSWMGEYFWVQPSMTRSQEIHVKRNTDPEKEEWCEEKFGKSGHKWFVKNNIFYFKNKEDMTMFVLRWS